MCEKNTIINSFFFFHLLLSEIKNRNLHIILITLTLFVQNNDYVWSGPFSVSGTRMKNDNNNNN